MQKQWNLVLPDGIVWVWLTAVVVSLFIPIWSSTQVSTFTDYTDHLRAITAAITELSAGQFPLRTVNFLAFPWHYPMFQFYGSVPYTLAALVGLLPFHFTAYSVYKITIAIPEIIGAFYLYRFIFSYVKESISPILACMAYLYCPLNICDIDYLAGYTEAIAIGIFPVLLYYAAALFDDPKRWSLILKTAFLWFLLISTHIITTIYLSIFLALYFLTIIVINKRSLKEVSGLVVAYIIGFLLSLWYILPMAYVQNSLLVHIGYHYWFWTMFGEMSAHTILSLIAHVYEVVKQTPDMTVFAYVRPGMGGGLLAGVILFIYWALRERRDPWLRAENIGLGLVFLATMFLLLAPESVWSYAPPMLLVLEMRRRLLIYIMWTGAFFLGWAMHRCLQTRFRWGWVAIVLTMMFISTYSWLTKVPINFMPLDQMVLKQVMLERYPFYLNNEVYKVDHIDNMQFYDAIVDNPYSDGSYDVPVGRWNKSTSPRKWLPLDVPFDIPASTIKNADHPTLYVENRPEPYFRYGSGITAWVNGKEAATYLWVTPFTVFGVPLSAQPGEKYIHVQFNPADQGVNGSQTSQGISLPVSQMFIGGFMPADKVRQLPSVFPDCYVQGSYTSCELGPQPGVDLVELPVLYYPSMLSFRVNGHAVPYESVLYGEVIITGFKPYADRPNFVEIYFSGIKYANWISAITWVLCLSFSAWLGYRNWVSRRAAVK